MLVRMGPTISGKWYRDPQITRHHLVSLTYGKTEAQKGRED